MTVDHSTVPCAMCGEPLASHDSATYREHTIVWYADPDRTAGELIMSLHNALALLAAHLTAGDPVDAYRKAVTGAALCHEALDRRRSQGLDQEPYE